MKKLFPVTVMGKQLCLYQSNYAEGNDAFVLAEPEPEDVDELFAIVSINLSPYGQHPSEGCFWLKNYSENKGIAEELIAQGCIELTGRTTNSGFVTIPEARIVRKR